MSQSDVLDKQLNRLSESLAHDSSAFGKTRPAAVTAVKLPAEQPSQRQAGISLRLRRLWNNAWQKVSSSEVLLRLISPLVLLLLWELAARTGLLPARIIAAPSAIGGTLWNMIISGELLTHLLVSLKRAMLGLTIGVSIGTVLALVAGLSRKGELAVDSPMQMLRTLPFLAIVPLFILWFGVGETPKIALIALGTTFPIYLTLFSGIRNLDIKLIEAAKTLGLNQREQIWHVVLPGALPSFFVGLRYSFGISWLGLVVVEQINATAGIGYLVNDARDFMRTDVIVICLIIYSVLGLGIDAIVRALEKAALSWRNTYVGQ